MPTLKPHLFIEMMDTLVEASIKRRSRNKYYRWNFVHHGICDLAMSSQHAYRIVAYLLKNVLIDIYRSPYPRRVLFDSPTVHWHPLSFEMSEKQHIQALMRYAGQYCTLAFHDESRDPAGWHQPIYDGLAMNEIMTSTVALNDEAVIKAVRKGRNVHDVIVLRPSLLQLKWLGDDLIKTLVVGNINRLQTEGFSLWDGMKIERIEFPDVKGVIYSRDVLHPHRPQPAYLKSLCMDQQIVVENVIQMLKRHLFLKDIEFNNARFKPAQHLNFEDALKYVQRKVNQLWKYIVAHPATTITVKCSLKGYRFKDPEKLHKVMRFLSKEFAIQATNRNAAGVMRRTVASKLLEVTFVV